MSYFIYKEDGAFFVQQDQSEKDQPWGEYKTFTEAKREAIKMQQREIERLRKNLKLLKIMRKYDFTKWAIRGSAAN